jgi:hypothetical protein
MDRTARLLIATTVLAWTGASFTPPAHAQVALAWNNCYGTANATQALQYACDGSLDGNSRRLVMSYELPASIDSMSMTRGVVEFRSLAPALLPDYWRVHGGGCREGVISYTPVHGAVGDPLLCANPFAGYPYNGSGGVGFGQGPDYFRAEGSMGTGFRIPVMGGKKYTAGVILIDPVLGDCAGCEQEICIQLVAVEIYFQGLPARPPVTLSGPNSTSFVTWQGLAPGICFGATPARNRTWGAIKTLYR